MNKTLIILSILIVFLAVGGLLIWSKSKKVSTNKNNQGQTNQLEADPLAIETLKKGNYPGSDITIEQTLDPGSNYQRYIASYKSEGLKIYALLTIPNGQKPQNGWPVVVFNHGFIQPSQYRTTERYVAYVDGFARSGYIVFKPDFRGNGNSEGQPTGAYGSNGYTIDVLNAVSSIKKFKDADPQKIGMWGHSMGGFITLRAMVVDPQIKVGVIWGGVVASYPDLITKWRRGPSTPFPIPSGFNRNWRQSLIQKYGTPEQNPTFWNSISANSYLSNIAGPIQLHHSETDETVPVEFSKTLADQLKAAGKTVELYTYPGDDHNISANFNTAEQRSVDFFNKYLKGGD